MPRTARFDHALVAGLVDAARTLEVPVAPHVAKVLGVDVGTARNAIGSARRAGVLLPAHNIPKVRRGVTPGLALRCSCGNPKAVYPANRLLDLFKHCRREHGRQPSREEKTPR